MDFLGKLFGGVKNFFGGATQAAKGALNTGGQAIGGAVNAGANLGKNLVGQLGPMNMFGGSQAFAGQAPKTSPVNIPMMGASPSPRMGAMQAATSPISNSSGMDSLINPEKSGKKSFLESLFPGGTAQGMAGLAAPLLGDMFAPKSPSIPDINSLSSVQALQGFKPGNSVSPEYQQMLQRNTQQLRDTKVRELQALYHNARPGTDYLTDSSYQRDLANLDKGIQDNLTDELTKAESTFSTQEQDRLSQIAQMDIYSIMAQTGLEAQEAQQFKEMFGNVGNMFLTNATSDPGSAVMDKFLARLQGV